MQAAKQLRSCASSESGLRMSYLITYTNVNGYLIPNLTYKSGEQMEQLGKYGFLRRDGIDSVRSAIKELENHGYVERHRF